MILLAALLAGVVVGATGVIGYALMLSLSEDYDSGSLDWGPLVVLLGVMAGLAVLAIAVLRCGVIHCG